MSNIAIIGHPTRGKEVIEILEMLGGKIRRDRLAGNEVCCRYYINSDGYIDYKHSSLFYDATFFILEKFLEYFPYKVGDKVQHKGATSCGSVFEVEKMRWVGTHIEYTVKRLWYYNGYYTVTAEDLQPYKEETMEEDSILNQLIEYFKNTPRDIIEKEWHEYDKYNEIGPTVKEYLESINKSKYPKTYKECCEVLMGKTDFQDYTLLLTKLSITINEADSISPDPPYITLINNFYKLLICRDAYWKIAGEQMGLDKPWEPDWDNLSTPHEFITIKNGCFVYSSRVLVFPTKEMCDIFYENFKELIEKCKELL